MNRLFVTRCLLNIYMLGGQLHSSKIANQQSAAVSSDTLLVRRRYAWSRCQSIIYGFNQRSKAPSKQFHMSNSFHFFLVPFHACLLFSQLLYTAQAVEQQYVRGCSFSNFSHASPGFICGTYHVAASRFVSQSDGLLCCTSVAVTAERWHLPLRNKRRRRSQLACRR